jgi:hypothetical protein
MRRCAPIAMPIAFVQAISWPWRSAMAGRPAAAYRSEGVANLSAEDRGLFPGGEVTAGLGLVEIN